MIPDKLKSPEETQTECKSGGEGKQGGVCKLSELSASTGHLGKCASACFHELFIYGE